MTKTQIRKEIFAKRRELSWEIQREKNEQLYHNLKQVLDRLSFDVLFTYAAYNKEANPGQVIYDCFEKNIPVCYPAVNSDEIRMEFYRVFSEHDLFAGYHGIPEPVGMTEPYQVTESQRVVILVPGVAFSEQGSRIGYGKGFYDRYFASHLFGTKIGIAYEFQVYPELVSTPQDIPVDILVTEKRILSM